MLWEPENRPSILVKDKTKNKIQKSKSLLLKSYEVTKSGKMFVPVLH